MRKNLILLSVFIGFSLTCIKISKGQNFENVVHRFEDKDERVFKVQMNLKQWGYFNGESYGGVLAGYGSSILIGILDSHETLRPIILKIDSSGEFSKIVLPNLYVNGIEDFPNQFDMTEKYIIGGSSLQGALYNGSVATKKFSNNSPFIMEKSENGTWEFKQILNLKRKSQPQKYGRSVAVDGDYAVVGAEWDNTDENEENKIRYSGSSYVFKRQVNGEWEFVQKLVPLERGKDDYFGQSVDIDNNCIIIGAPKNNKNAGAVYVFNLNDKGKWVQKQKLTISKSMPKDYAR